MALIVAAVVIVSVSARIQVHHWESSVKLFRHIITCTDNNFIAHCNLGVALMAQGRYKEALKHLKESDRIYPDFHKTKFDLGVCHENIGDPKKAIEYFNWIIQNDSTNAIGYFRLGKIVRENGGDSSSYFLRRAVRIKPDYWKAFFELGRTMHEKDSLNVAIRCFSEVIRLNPEFWPAYYFLALSWNKKDDFQRAFIRSMEAIEHCKGSSMEPYLGFGILLFKKGKLNSAKELFSKAIGISPAQPEAYCNRAVIYGIQGILDSAEADYRRALRLKPDLAATCKRRIETYIKKGKKELAGGNRVSAP